MLTPSAELAAIGPGRWVALAVSAERPVPLAPSVAVRRLGPEPTAVRAELPAAEPGV